MSCNGCQNLINGGICVWEIGMECKEGGSPSENTKEHFRHNCYSNRYLIINCEDCLQKLSCMREHNNKLPYRISRKEEIETTKHWSGHVYAEINLNNNNTVDIKMSFSGADIIIRNIKAEIKRNYR